MRTKRSDDVGAYLGLVGLGWIIVIVAKLGGQAEWLSWWWVLCPLWLLLWLMAIGLAISAGQAVAAFFNE